MASSSLSLLHSPPLLNCRSSSVICLSSPLLHRRSLSFILLSSPAASLLSFTPASRAQDIPLFGLRKKLEKVEEEVEQIVKEGEEAVEKEIESAEQEIAGGLGFAVAGDLNQAGAVAGAEAVGVLVGVSIVNGILAPEGKEL